MNMVWIAPASFQMGDATGRGRADEKPVHEVRLATGYWLGESEVTQEQWQAVMGTNPSHFKGPNLPVEGVSWNDAVEYCQKLTQRERAAGRLRAGVEYRLPTEAQWEYACRARSTGDYGGDLEAMAWHDSNSGGRTHEVKTKRPNAWGLYDMHGNVWEWCSDWYGSYSAGLQVDPKGPGTGPARVVRGGSWNDSGPNCRSARRLSSTPEARSNFLGFRLAAVPSR
jgi:formylglycine-generating enzyme required for sulfatase activity